MPNVYFTGNTKSFETKLLHVGNSQCRLVCVPKFSETHSFAVVNLVNLEAFEVKFDF